LPDGDNKIIGFYADKIRNRAYYFLWNSNGYNSILYYDLSTDEITTVLESKTDSDDIDILNFNPSYKVLSINIYYRDDEGDILFFNDGLNPPRNINVIAKYFPWKAEYLNVIKAPPIMPAKVVYENEDSEDFTINNLRNKLFQFCYRYVYDNNEKSVWSTKSIVALPQQPSPQLTNDDFRNNARLSLSFSTGGADVKQIEISFRETTNGLTSDWYLITQIDKQEYSILDNSIFNYKFYNDGIYSIVEVNDAIQLQDWVPQKANAGELANGNVLLYSGITEGYDKTNMNVVPTTNQSLESYFLDQCGLLFFATINGTDSNGVGTEMKVYVYGTGTNTDSIVTTLNNPSGIYVINAIDGDGNNVGISYTYNSTTPLLVSSLLSSISAALITQGWTTSILNNILTATYPTEVTLLSSGTKHLQVNNQPNNTTLAYAWDSGYQYAVQYFDKEGRTIGAQINLDGTGFNNNTFNTPNSPIPADIPTGYDGRFPKVFLYISNRPPSYASYYQIVRSNNTTYNKRLFWISSGAFKSQYVSAEVPMYIYINVDNIQLYNEQISSTANVVSYTFTEGDRIKFLTRYDTAGNPVTYYNNRSFDYEIIGTETSISLYGNTITGNFVKINYPTNDISATFNFDSGVDFQHYEILLYNYTTNASSNQRTFYEFGKCFGIGNAGTEMAYHIGLDETQSATNPTGDPAKISITNGDLFYRIRKVPAYFSYSFPSGSQDTGIPPGTPGYQTYNISAQGIALDANVNFEFGSQTAQNVVVGGYPQYTDTGYYFKNKSANDILLKIKFDAGYSATSVTIQIQALIVTNLGRTYVPLIYRGGTTATSEIISVDTIITVPTEAKVWLVTTGYNTTISPFTLYGSVVQNININIIESSFNDTYNLVTNSNGRPSVIDENAAKRYFPTLIRFGQAYQFNTNLNATNRFFYENFDEYDRSFGDVMRLHVRDRYLKVYQKFKVGNVPILTQIVKDSANNPLQANTDTLINKIQYYAGDYGIGDASTSLAWNNFSDYFVDNYRGVVCRLSQDGITPLSIIYNTNAFFVPVLQQYRQELNNNVAPAGQTYMGNPCIYGVFDAYTNKYLIAMEEINRYEAICTYNGGSAVAQAIDCDYNSGSAIVTGGTHCELVGGSVVTLGNCTLTPGSFVII
jgi:hypothetical protein